MWKLLSVVCVFMFYASTCWAGIHIDSLFQFASKLKFYLLPSLSYQPLTHYAAGVNGGYFFHFIDPVKMSSVNFNLVFTQKGQFNINVYPRIYWGHQGSWFLTSFATVQNYPNYFVGVGNNPTKLLLSHPLPYTSRNVSIGIQPQRYISKRFLFGLQWFFRRERTIMSDSLRLKAYAQQRTGWDPYFMVGVGALISYDSRNSQYDPLNGVFYKGSFLYCDPLMGSSHHIVQLTFDFRHFIQLYHHHVLAWQFLTDWRLGDAVPFQFLSTIGGQDILRGFPSGMFRDNGMAALQTEYRFPIYDNFSGAVFGATGDVLNSKRMTLYRLKTSYGAGLRFRITKANINFRLDVTHNNYFKGFQYYLTTGNAF
ncbi:MAG: BamA/TamA family outer membrane protein [Microbacter sp.]